jgi:hypothetical protein
MYNSNLNVAHVYYSLSANETQTLIPAIVFKNVDTYTNVQAYDFSLFRYNIFVQTAYNNNSTIPSNLSNISNFSKCCIGQLQIYPFAFIGAAVDTHPFLLTNEIDGNTNYQISSGLAYAPNGRLFYSSGIINAGLINILTLNCSYSNNESKLLFNFNKLTEEQLDPDIKLIFSIQIELLNPGKIPKDSITTENFDLNFDIYV